MKKTNDMEMQKQIEHAELLLKERTELGLTDSASLISLVLKSAKKAKTEDEKTAALESLKCFK